MRVLLLALSLTLALPNTSWGQGARTGDVVFDRGALSARLSGRVLEFFDASTASYASDAGYAYRYRPEDPPFIGVWETNDDSQVCVLFDNGFSRCDWIVEASGRLVLITSDGLRFPVREERSIPE